MEPLRTKFYKQQLINSLENAVISPYKDTFIESFIKVTDIWFSSKLCLISEVLPPYHNVEVHDFLTKEEIIRILSCKQYHDEVLLDNLIMRLKNLIQELASKSIWKSDLIATYYETTGTILISYVQ